MHTRLMQMTLKEIATLIRGEVVGDERTVVSGIGGIKEARPGDLTFLSNARYLPLLQTTAASAVITSRDVQQAGKPIIRTDNPSLAFAEAAKILTPMDVHHPQGIHPTAVISERARVGRGVAVGPYVVIDDGAEIGERTILYPFVYVGRDARIGAESLLYPQVMLREGVTVGRRVIIHSGAVIGSDGFGFETVDGVHHKIPQTGTVVIEDDVELGANVSIDRARFGITRIGQGTKVDNLVHIAHNVTVGPHALLIAQVGISGSTTLGHHVTLAGQVGVVGHITIGDHAVVGAQGGVTKSVPAGEVWWGYPARPMDEVKKSYASVKLLPKLFKRVDALTKQVEALEKASHGSSATHRRARRAR